MAEKMYATAQSFNLHLSPCQLGDSNLFIRSRYSNKAESVAESQLYSARSAQSRVSSRQM